MSHPDDDSPTADELESYFRAIEVAQAQARAEDAAPPQSGAVQVDEATLALALDNALIRLRPNLQAELSAMLQQQLQQFAKSLADISGDLRAASDRLQQSQNQAAIQLQALSRRSLGFMAATAFILMLGTGYVVWHNLQQVQRLQVETDVRRALQQVTITACGKQPCIKLDEKAQRWGADKDYVLLDTQAPQTRPATER